MNLSRTRDLLQALDFATLFIEELGWSHPPARKAVPAQAVAIAYTRKPIAQLAGVTVFEITTPDGAVPDAPTRAAIHKDVSAVCHENLLIFLDAQRTQSLWLWAKREQGKLQLRNHLYVKGQPGDLFLSKLGALVVDISELDPDGKVQMIYFNPPCSIKFSANFQPQLGQIDVKNRWQNLTREPKTIKAYHDISNNCDRAGRRNRTASAWCSAQNVASFEAAQVPRSCN